MQKSRWHTRESARKFNQVSILTRNTKLKSGLLPPMESCPSSSYRSMNYLAKLMRVNRNNQSLLGFLSDLTPEIKIQNSFLKSCKVDTAGK